MDLYIVRHAWAGHFGDPHWPDDSQRPLSADGRERFARVVARLADSGFSPRIIATSPMARCVETAQLIAEGVSGDPEVVQLEALLPGYDLAALLKWTEDQSAGHNRVAWVGHAPDVGRLAAELIGRTDAWIRFAKGAIAELRFHESPEIGTAELRWLVTARVLGC